jgi:hypothetical protein
MTDGEPKELSAWLAWARRKREIAKEAAAMQNDVIQTALVKDRLVGIRSAHLQEASHD